MKKNIYLIIALLGVILFSCSDDDDKKGNPQINVKTEFGSALFGDSLAISLDASDNDVALSTVKAQLFFDDEKVSETVVRTKTNGIYDFKLLVPYFANVPNGTATLKIVLQNINFTITEQEYALKLTRPDYEYITFVDSEEKEYKMTRVSLYNYEVKGDFPEKLKGYFKAPKASANNNEMTFGWETNAITQGITDLISFSYYYDDNYTVSFNTLNYEAAPFLYNEVKINDKLMSVASETSYKIDLSLKQGDKMTFEGFKNLDQWIFDTDYFVEDSDGNITFAPITGSYRITADLKTTYFSVETLKDGKEATLQNDGNGAIWVIGNGVGKPSLSNEVGWTTEKGLCMAPVGNKKYQMTFVAGKTIKSGEIDFKFFHQKGWGGEFKHETISTTSDIIFIGDGTEATNKKGNGNLGLVVGKTLEEGANYTFTVDLSAGNDKAILTVIKK